MLAAIAALALPMPAYASGVIDNVNGIAIGPDGKIALSRPLDDARFGEAFSGLYWQIEEDKLAAPSQAQLRSFRD